MVHISISKYTHKISCKYMYVYHVCIRTRAHTHHVKIMPGYGIAQVQGSCGPYGMGGPAAGKRLWNLLRTLPLTTIAIIFVGS